MIITCHILQGRPDFIMLTFREQRPSGIKAYRQCPARPESARFAWPSLWVSIFPAFHLPVDFPHKVQIAQALQGWFENADSVILTELCNINIQELYFQWLRYIKIQNQMLRGSSRNKNAFGAVSFALLLWSHRCCHWWPVLILEVVKHVEASTDVWNHFIHQACFIFKIQRFSLENAMAACLQLQRQYLTLLSENVFLT